MKNISLKKETLLLYIKRFHFVIFMVIMAIVLSVSVLLLYSVVYKASGEDSVPLDGVTTGFDQSTIDRIQQLKTSDAPSEPLDLSQGRINPFGE